MSKYNVHVFREMRLYFPGIEADSPEEAAKLASDLKTGFSGGIEDCDGVGLGAMVDVEGDDNFEYSRMIDFESQRMMNAAPKLLAALTALSGLEVKGHPLLARLQFSEEGRKLAAQVSDAIAEATGDSARRAP